MKAGREGFAGKRADALRWIGAGAMALGLHAGAALLILRDAHPDPLDAGSGDAVAVDLDPVEGEAAKPDEVQPAVPADEASDAAGAAAAAQSSRAAAQPPPEATRPPPPEAVPDDPSPPPPPLPEPLPKAPEPPRPEAPPVRAAQPAASSAASAPAEDAAPAVQRLSAARVASWRGKLVPHLNRFRRALPGIGGGTARVGFTVDAEGRVTAVSIATSSGDAALDEAARALIQRASPFPPPPPGLGGGALSFVVPIHYDARRP